MTSQQSMVLAYAEKAIETMRVLLGAKPTDASDIREIARCARMGASMLDQLAAEWGDETRGGDYARNVVTQEVRS